MRIDKEEGVRCPLSVLYSIRSAQVCGLALFDAYITHFKIRSCKVPGAKNEKHRYTAPSCNVTMFPDA